MPGTTGTTGSTGERNLKRVNFFSFSDAGTTGATGSAHTTVEGKLTDVNRCGFWTDRRQTAIAASFNLSRRRLQILQCADRIRPILRVRSGTGHAVLKGMVARRYQDLIAWQLGSEFCDEVTRLLGNSPTASRNFKYAAELLEAAESVPSNIAEGFLRFSPRELCRFIDIALGTLGEAETRLRRGIRRGYFTANECEAAFRLGRRCLSASVGLKKSQSDRGGR